MSLFLLVHYSLTTMETFGYIGALIMGLSLGIMGGGGSILTVPILVYLFSLDAVAATAYSLFVVGFTSLIGSVNHIRLGNVHLQTALTFGIPSVVSVYITRMYLVPLIPEELFSVGHFVLSKPVFLLVLFACIMLLASYSMIRRPKLPAEEYTGNVSYNYPLLLFQGLGLGVVTGLVGAGGGFLIIPALVLFAHLPMRQAVGTSLIIIAMNSLMGFVGGLNKHTIIDWRFLVVFSCIAMVGILMGSFLSGKVSNEKLRTSFGWFVLMMGVYIIVREVMW